MVILHSLLNLKHNTLSAYGTEYSKKLALSLKTIPCIIFVMCLFKFDQLTCLKSTGRKPETMCYIKHWSTIITFFLGEYQVRDECY